MTAEVRGQDTPRLAVQIYLERTLFRLYLVFLLLGVPFFTYLATAWWNHWLRWVHLGFLGYIVLLTWGRLAYWLSFQVRVWMGLVLFYGLALLTGLVFANPVQMTLWLIAAPFFGALFLSFQEMVVNTVAALGLGGSLLYIQATQRFPAGLPVLSEEPWGLAFSVLVMVVIVAQAIFALYRRRLETALEESHALTQILEEERQRLEEQGALLEKRVEQIRTVAEITQVLGGLFSEEEIAQTFVERVRAAFDLYYVGVFLAETEQGVARLLAGSGEAGRRMVQEGYRLPLGGGSMIAWAIAHRKPRFTADVRQDPTYFPNPYLPETRSEGALPLMARGEVLGAVTVQSTQPGTFDEETMEILQLLADRLASALANARLFTQLQQADRRLEALQRHLTGLAWAEAREEEIRAEATGSEPGRGPWLRIPLLLHGVEIGEMVLQRERPWTDEERSLLYSALQHYLTALHAALLFQQSRAAVQAQERQREFVERLGAHLDVEAVLEEALGYLVRLFRAEEARIVFATDGQPSPEHEEET